MSIRCSSSGQGDCEKFEIKYCCPSTFDNDEELEKATPPFPKFNLERNGSCSKNAPQYEEGILMEIEGSFLFFFVHLFRILSF